MTRPPRAAVWFCAIALVYIVIYGSFLAVYYSSLTYSAVPDERLDTNAEVLSFLRDGTELDIGERENSHMEDVQNLLGIFRILGLLCLGLFLGMWVGLKKTFEKVLSKALWYSGWMIIIGGALVGLSILLDFNRFWVLFHVFLFPQGNWLFPIDSVLIQTYPQAFWSRAVTFWATQTVFAGVVLVVLGWFFQATEFHHEVFHHKAKEQKNNRHRK